MTRFCVATTQFEALHLVENPPLLEKHLKGTHLSTFSVYVEVETKGDDQDCTLFSVKRWLRKVVDEVPRKGVLGFLSSGKDKDIGALSCEGIADLVVSLCKEKFGEWRNVRCTVTENGSAGYGIISIGEKEGE